MTRRDTVTVSCFRDISSSFPNPVIDDRHTQQKGHLQDKTSRYLLLVINSLPQDSWSALANIIIP